MKLTYPSATVCRLQFQSWNGRLMGLLFVIIGLGILVMYFSTSKISCVEKKPGIAMRCVLKEKIAYFYHSATPIGDLKNTQIKTVYTAPTQSNQQGSYSYQVLLLTTALPTGIAFNALSSSSYSGALMLQKTINNYIQNSSQETIRLPNTSSLLLLLFPILFIPIGIKVFLSSAKIQLDLDKATQKATLSSTSMTGATTRVIDFSQLSQFVVDSRSSSNNNNNMVNNNPMNIDGFSIMNQNQMMNNQIVYGLALELHDHSRLALSQAYDNFYQQKAAIAQKLNQWIAPQESASGTGSPIPPH